MYVPVGKTASCGDIPPPQTILASGVLGASTILGSSPIPLHPPI